MSAPLLAAEIVCPVDSVIRETRARNQTAGRSFDDSFYRRLADSYREQCKSATQRIGDYSERLKEYQQGQRADRDGYIILQKIFNSYEVLRATTTVEAGDIKKQLNAIIEKHPDYPTLQDFRLSEEIADKAKKRSLKAETVKQASAWTPKDQTPLAIIASKDRLVARYQYQLAFYKLPSEVRVNDDSPRSIIERKSQAGTWEAISLSQLVPENVMTFGQVIDVYPLNVHGIGDSNLLVCTNPFSNYSAITEEERKIIQSKGSPNGAMHWIKPDGKYKDFCGIVSQRGKVLFQFPFKQHNPNALLMPLAIADAGTRAAVAVGERVMVDDEDGSAEDVGKIREVLIWESPDKVRSVKKLPPFENTNELAALFMDRKL
jgi:hypothetical protein